MIAKKINPLTKIISIKYCTKDKSMIYYRYKIKLCVLALVIKFTVKDTKLCRSHAL